MQKSLAPAPLPTRDIVRVVAFMVAATGLFACLDATAKFLAIERHLPPVELAWIRLSGQMFGMLALFGVLNLPRLVATQRPALQFVRSTLMIGATGFNFLALQTLRLDQTVTVAFLAPLVVALLAGPFLGEWVGWRRLAAVASGFMGVVVAVHPGIHGLGPGVLWAFGAMLSYALFMLLTRHLAPIDPPLVTLFLSMLAGSILGAPIALSIWVWPAHAFDYLLLASLGLYGGVGHYLFIRAYMLAPASVVSPFIYVQLLAMVGLGYLVFGDLPDLLTLTGAVIIIGSGVYLFHRQRVTGTRGLAPPPEA